MNNPLAPIKSIAGSLSTIIERSRPRPTGAKTCSEAST